MKKLLLTLILAFAVIPQAYCQNVSSNSVSAELYGAGARIPRFQLFSTHNEWSFLKLDTMTGKIWIVQYANNSANRFERVLDDNNRVREGAEAICGRFTLYRARDWNFILLDTIDGRCWHVQWAMNDEMCNVWRIFP